MEEQIYTPDINPQTDNAPKFTEEAKRHLAEGAKWAKFLAIVCSIGLGLLLILCITMSSWISKIGSMASVPGVSMKMVGMFYIMIALVSIAIYAYPLYALYRFALRAEQAVKGNDTQSLTKAMEYQKWFYQYVGILVIIGLCFYGVVLAIMMIGLSSLPM